MTAPVTATDLRIRLATLLATACQQLPAILPASFEDQAIKPLVDTLSAVDDLIAQTIRATSAAVVVGESCRATFFGHPCLLPAGHQGVHHAQSGDFHGSAANGTAVDHIDAPLPPVAAALESQREPADGRAVVRTGEGGMRV